MGGFRLASTTALRCEEFPHCGGSGAGPRSHDAGGSRRPFPGLRRLAGPRRRSRAAELTECRGAQRPQPKNAPADQRACNSANSSIRNSASPMLTVYSALLQRVIHFN